MYKYKNHYIPPRPCILGNRGGLVCIIIFSVGGFCTIVIILYQPANLMKRVLQLPLLCQKWDNIQSSASSNQAYCYTAYQASLQA